MELCTVRSNPSQTGLLTILSRWHHRDTRIFLGREGSNRSRSRISRILIIFLVFALASCNLILDAAVRAAGGYEPGRFKDLHDTA